MKPKGDTGETARRAPRLPRNRPPDAGAKRDAGDRRKFRPVDDGELAAREREDPGSQRAFLKRLYRVCVEEHARGQERARVQRKLDQVVDEFRAVLLSEGSVVGRERHKLEKQAEKGDRFAQAELASIDLYFARRLPPPQVVEFDHLVSMLPRLRRTMSPDRQFVRAASRLATLQEIAEVLNTTAESVRQIKSALRKDPAHDDTRAIRLSPAMVSVVDEESVMPERDEWPDED